MNADIDSPANAAARPILSRWSGDTRASTRSDFADTGGPPYLPVQLYGVDWVRGQAICRRALLAAIARRQGGTWRSIPRPHAHDRGARPGDRVPAAGRASHDGQRDLDVVARRVAVRANLMGLGDEVLGDGAVDAGQLSFKIHPKLEPPGVVGPDADLRGDRRVADVDFLATGYHLQGAVEAGGVPGREQLLRIGERAAGA